jgi:hypothetical protein
LPLEKGGGIDIPNPRVGECPLFEDARGTDAIVSVPPTPLEDGSGILTQIHYGSV